MDFHRTSRQTVFARREIARAKIFFQPARGRKLNAIREFARELPRTSTRCSHQVANTPLTALLAGVKSATRIDRLTVVSSNNTNNKSRCD